MKKRKFFVYLPNISHFMHFQSVRQRNVTFIFFMNNNKTSKYRWHFRSKPHQTTSLRSKVIINTLCTKTNNLILRYQQFFYQFVCLLFRQYPPPPFPLLPHIMYRFKYYVLYYDDDKNSPTKPDLMYELCDPRVN